MKRAASTLAAVAAGTLLLSAPAVASEEVIASRILSSIYASLGMDNQPAEIETSRNGIFFGVHTAVGPDSGILPVASGLSSPLLLDRGFENSITANGYYVYQTNFSLGTYVGGGFGRFNLVDNALINPAAQRGNYGVQGMAGLTFAFSPSMVPPTGRKRHAALRLPVKLTASPDKDSVTRRMLRHVGLLLHGAAPSPIALAFAYAIGLAAAALAWQAGPGGIAGATLALLAIDWAAGIIANATRSTRIAHAPTLRGETCTAPEPQTHSTRPTSTASLSSRGSVTSMPSRETTQSPSRASSTPRVKMRSATAFTMGGEK